MDTFQSKLHKNYAKSSKMTSIEETIQLARLQQAANSSLYERKPNQKALKVLTVAAYILFVSMAAIILSFYYVFIWDPTSKVMAPRPAINCETAKKIVIPESIAIKLANSSEVPVEYFFHDIYQRYLDHQREEQKDRQRSMHLSKKMRIHKPPSSEIATLKERTIIEKIIRSTISPIDESSLIRSTDNPIQSTTNSFIVQSRDQAYMDDEDLENDLEASGLNRIKNDTSIAYNFDEPSENDN